MENKVFFLTVDFIILSDSVFVQIFSILRFALTNPGCAVSRPLLTALLRFFRI